MTVKYLTICQFEGLGIHSNWLSLDKILNDIMMDLTSLLSQFRMIFGIASVGNNWRNSADVIFALMLREMATRYGRSWGGYVWAVIEPIAMISLLAFVFSYFLVTPPIGESFVLFYTTGFLPFMAFSEVVNQTGSSLTQNRNLIYFPPVTPLDTVIARFGLSCATLVVISALVFSGALIYTGHGFDVKIEFLLSGMAAAVVLGLGIGTLNALLFAFLPAWRIIWSILSRPLFLISGIFFVFDTLPNDAQGLLWWNPLIHVIGLTRMAFYSTYDGNYVSISFAYGIGIVTFIIGAALIIRNRSFLVESL